VIKGRGGVMVINLEFSIIKLGGLRRIINC
jgi:hypothetical protein